MPVNDHYISADFINFTIPDKIIIIFWDFFSIVFGLERTDIHDTRIGKTSILTTETLPNIVRFQQPRSCINFFIDFFFCKIIFSKLNLLQII